MSNAKHDENNKPTAICASQDDGTTIVPITADPTSHAVRVSSVIHADSGNNGGNAMLDENSVPVFMALSSHGDGTLVEVYADPVTGAILIEQ